MKSFRNNLLDNSPTLLNARDETNVMDEFYESNESKAVEFQAIKNSLNKVKNVKK